MWRKGQRSSRAVLRAIAFLSAIAAVQDGLAQLQPAVDCQGSNPIRCPDSTSGAPDVYSEGCVTCSASSPDPNCHSAVTALAFVGGGYEPGCHLLLTAECGANCTQGSAVTDSGRAGIQWLYQVRRKDGAPIASGTQIPLIIDFQATLYTVGTPDLFGGTATMSQAVVR